MQVAMVTGCGRSNGIGAAVARRLAAAGMAVAALDLPVAPGSAGDDLDSLIESITASGGQAIACRGDVSSAIDTEAAVAQTVEQFGPVSVVVNNAGAPQGADRVVISDVPLAEWQRQIDINLTGPFLMMKAATPHMIERGYGRIVNVSSAVAMTGIGKRAAYAASKAGVLGLTRATAAELAPHGITVNAVLPGAVATSRAVGTAQRESSSESVDEALAKRAAGIPVRRNGMPDDLAATIAFLASADAGYITGQFVTVDGGASVLRA